MVYYISYIPVYLNLIYLDISGIIYQIPISDVQNNSKAYQISYTVYGLGYTVNKISYVLH